MTQLIGLREKTLLFAEDDDIIRYNTLGILSVFFKKVITAKDGQEALEKYVDEKPDIIMTDIKMPIMDGLDFITEVRKVDVFTPIVLFSAYNEQRYLAKAINLKVEGLILKPIKLDELFAVLARCAKSLGSTNESEVLFSEGVVYNVNTNEVFKNGRPLVLGAKEYALLGLLMSKYPHILTKEETSQKIWALESVSDSAMKNIIARLRAKIGVKHIVAIPGIGWRLEMDAGQGRAG